MRLQVRIENEIDFVSTLPSHAYAYKCVGALTRRHYAGTDSPIGLDPTRK